MFLDQVILEDDIVPGSLVIRLEPAGVLCIVVGRHVNSIQPHLVGIGRLSMPEAAILIARRKIELLAESVCGNLILLVASDGPQV